MSWLTGKDPDAGKDWRQKEKGATENETVGWHHQFKGREFEQTPEDSERQGNLAVVQLRVGYTEQLNNNIPSVISKML